MAAIELHDVRHVFRTTTGTLRRRPKEIVALEGLSLKIEEGELALAGFAFFGWMEVRARQRGTLEAM